jgi:hypothetical protein
MTSKSQEGTKLAIIVAVFTGLLIFGALFGFQLALTQLILRKSSFHELRYRSDSEALLFKVALLIVLPLTLSVIVGLQYFALENLTLFNFISGAGAAIIALFFAFMSTYAREISNRFRAKCIKIGESRIMTSDILGEPNDKEIEFIKSGKKLSSKSVS